MDEHHGLSTRELGVQRLVTLVTEVDALGVGLDGHTVTAQIVERPAQFGKRTLDIGQRERGEVPVPVGVVAPEASSCVIDVPRQDTGRRVAAEVHPRR